MLHISTSKQRLQISCLLLSLIGGAMLLQYIDEPMVTREQAQPISVYTPDWGVAATLISLGYPPFATSEPESYRLWLRVPRLPESVYNMGSRGQPNVELIAQLHPDLIIDTPAYKDNQAVYPQDIQTVSIDFKEAASLDFDSTPKWSDYANVIYKIADAIDRPDLAQPYLDKSDARIKAAGKAVRAKLGDNRHILVVNFWDMRQLSVMNNNSAIKLTADMMGLNLLSIGEPTKWGSNYVYPNVLYDLPADTCLIVIGPIPEMTKTDSVNSPIWQQSPFFKPDACLYKLAPVWSKAGIESMVSFANNFEAAVLTQSAAITPRTFITQNNNNRRVNPSVDFVDPLSLDPLDSKTVQPNAVINDLSYAYVHAHKDTH